MKKKVENYFLSDDIWLALRDKLDRDVGLYPKGKVLNCRSYIMTENGDVFRVSVKIEKTTDIEPKK